MAVAIDEKTIIDDAIKNATSEELKQKQEIIKEKQKELKTDENYQLYVNYYKIFHGDNNYKNLITKLKVIIQ